MKMFCDRKEQLGFFSGETVKGGRGDCLLFSKLALFPLIQGYEIIVHVPLRFPSLLVYLQSPGLAFLLLLYTSPRSHYFLCSSFTSYAMSG